MFYSDMRRLINLKVSYLLRCNQLVSLTSV